MPTSLLRYFYRKIFSSAALSALHVELGSLTGENRGKRMFKVNDFSCDMNGGRGSDAEHGQTIRK